MLSQADARLDRLTRTDEAVVLFPYEIKHVEGKAPISLRLFEAFEIPWAGNDSLYAAYTLPKLREESTLRTAPSPEVRRAANRALARRPASVPAGVPFDRASLQRLSNRLHVSLSYPRVLLTSPELSYDVGLTASSEAFALRKVLRPRPTYSVEATYSLTKRLRSAVSFSACSRGRPVKAFTQNSYSRISGFVLTPIATYTFNPVNRLDFLYHNSLFNPRKTEVRLGLGPSYARLTKETSVTWRYDKTGGARSRHQRAIGLTSLVGLDFYPISSSP